MKLSELKYRDIILQMKKEEVEKMVFAGTAQEEQKSDIGFVFCDPLSVPYVPKEALRLYNEGLVDRLLVAGGIGLNDATLKTRQTFRVVKCLTDLGVPIDKILIEARFSKAEESIKDSIELLKNGYDISKLKITVIALDYQVRRLMALFEHEIGQKENIAARGVSDGITDRLRWGNSLYGVKSVFVEASRLIKNAKEGKIEDIEILEIQLGRRHN